MEFNPFTSSYNSCPVTYIVQVLYMTIKYFTAFYTPRPMLCYVRSYFTFNWNHACIMSEFDLDSCIGLRVAVPLTASNLTFMGISSTTEFLIAMHTLSVLS